MTWTARIAVVALVGSLAGCGGGHRSSTPSEASPSASPSASGAADGVEQAYQAAVEPLLDEKVLDFDHAVYSGKSLAIQTAGRAFRHLGWEATTTTPQQLGSAKPPRGEDVKGEMDVRAVGKDVFLHLSTWPPPLSGCWLKTSGDQVPGGQLAMTPGVPGYITILGAVQAQQVVPGGGSAATLIGGQVPLRIGLQMFTTGVLGLLQLDASQLDGATVPVIVQVEKDVVTELDVSGVDLVTAVRSAGGDVTPDAEATISQLRISVGYRPGPKDSPPVTAPPDADVMSNADVKADKGCPAS